MFGAAAGPGLVAGDDTRPPRSSSNVPGKRRPLGRSEDRWDIRSPLRRNTDDEKLEPGLEQHERRRRDVVRVRLDPDLGLGCLLAQAGAELVRLLLREDV